jgi:hypothetical protein
VEGATRKGPANEKAGWGRVLARYRAAAGRGREKQSLNPESFRLITSIFDSCID